MFRNFSDLGKLFYVAFIITVMVTLATLSYGWSLGQPQLLFTLIMPSKGLALVAALLIQLLPQAAFAASYELVRKYMWVAAVLVMSIGIAANGIDAATNIGALQVSWEGKTLTPIAYYVGMSIAILITFGEEMLLLLFLSLVALLREYYGIDTSEESLLGRMARSARRGAVPAGVPYYQAYPQDGRNHNNKHNHNRHNHTAPQPIKQPGGKHGTDPFEPL